MRLLNTKTLVLKEFMSHEIPEYATLSHVWGDEEVSFQDMHTVHATEKQGYTKIQRTCQRAFHDSIEYAWVDTCCIDKTSSAELSEAVNSMMSWYERSKVCYAYLRDVSPSTSPDGNLPDFLDSKWFKRGWTLQELIAPARLEFLAEDWSLLFPREAVIHPVSRITRIRVSLLEQREYGASLRAKLNTTSIAERMSWASQRKTSRTEDVAYSLLGIFGIHMPLLYGEGAAAFVRLQEEIIRHSDDQSLLAWNFHGNNNESASDLLRAGIFAHSPAAFLGCGDFVPCDVGKSTPPFSMTNKGLSIEIPLLTSDESMFALIQCQARGDPTQVLGVPIECIRDNIYARVKAPIRRFGHKSWSRSPQSQLYLLPSLDFSRSTVKVPDFTVILKNLPPHLRITRAFPPSFLPERSPMVLMQGEHEPDIWNKTVDAFVWLGDTQEHFRSFILCFGIRGRIGPRLRFPKPTDFRTTYQLERDNNLPIEELKRSLWSNFVEVPSSEQDAIPYLAKVTGDIYFGKSLFRINIVSERPRNPFWTIMSLERELKVRWRHALRTKFAQGKPHFVRLLRYLRFCPWVFTFIIDSLLVEVLKTFFYITRSIVTDAQVAACVSTAWLLIPGNSVKDFLRGCIPGFLRNMPRENINGLVILYFCIKLIPESGFQNLQKEANSNTPNDNANEFIASPNLLFLFSRYT